MERDLNTNAGHSAWNKGKLVGQKPPLKLKEIWAIRIRLQLTKRVRDLAMFNLTVLIFGFLPQKRPKVRFTASTEGP